MSAQEVKSGTQRARGPSNGARIRCTRVHSLAVKCAGPGRGMLSPPSGIQCRVHRPCRARSVQTKGRPRTVSVSRSYVWSGCSERGALARRHEAMPAKAGIIMAQGTARGRRKRTRNSLRRNDFDYFRWQYSGTPAPIHRNNLRCRPRQADGDCGICAQVVYTYACYTAAPKPTHAGVDFAMYRRRKVAAMAAKSLFRDCLRAVVLFIATTASSRLLACTAHARLPTRARVRL
jgi:hypothetical protein